MECKFCGNKIDKEYDPYPNVCESCFDEINMEDPFGGNWIGHE